MDKQMDNDNAIYDVIIIGAGIAGLAAAWKLHQYGRRILVLEKSGGVGGRMATRRISGAVFDHGAQFITARESNFLGWLKALEKIGVVATWFGGQGDRNTHPRWLGIGGMNGIAKHLGSGLDIRLNTNVDGVVQQGPLWHVLLQQRTNHFSAAAILLTPPVPQSLDLLESRRAGIPEMTQSLLTKFTYERCLAVLARLREPTHLTPPGFLRKPSANIRWLADNQLKGISKQPAITIHATADFSLRHWLADRSHIAKILIQEAEAYLTMKILDYQVHGWRYSRPQYICEHRSLELWDEPPLVLAGDAFGGPRVEGAVLSGWDAAERLEERIRSRS